MPVSAANSAPQSARQADVSPWRTIALALTETRGDAEALEVAAGLARQFDAHLEVLQLLLMPTPFIDAWAIAPDPSLAQVYTDLREAARIRAERLRKQLEELAVSGEVRTLEALFIEPGGLAATAARRTDLVVLARPFGTSGDTSIVHAYFATLLQSAGRPILLVPPHTQPTFPIQHTVIAWSDTREAARAVHDALPLLRRCERVDVLLVDAIPTVLEPVQEQAEKIVRHLADHAVHARVVIEKSRNTTVAATILDHVRRSGAELLIAGGYGHSKTREWLLGGTTRELFHSSPVPVLFSH